MTQQLTEIEIDIAAPPERVWTALTDPTELEQWFCEHADVDLGEGRYDFWGRYTPFVPGRSQGRHEVEAVDAPRLLRYSWPLVTGPTSVEVTVEGLGDGTSRARILHTGIPVWGDGSHPGWRNMWATTLHGLRAFVELGEPAPRFDFASNIRDEIRLSVDVRSDRDATWRALIDTVGANLPLPERVGETSRVHIPHMESEEDSNVGIKLLDLVDGERVSYEWQWRLVRPSATVVTWSLEDSSGGTRITMVHSGFDSDYDGVSAMAQGFFETPLEIKYRAERGAGWRYATARVVRTTV